MVKDNRFEVAEVQLSYKSKVKASERARITTSKETYELLKSQWNSDTIELQEEFKVLLMGRGNIVLGLYTASTGSTVGTTVDPKLVFVAALKAKACALILSHNHPSGSVKPSSSDIGLTSRLVSAGALLDVPVIDHLIVTVDGYFSFADEGLI